MKWYFLGVIILALVIILSGFTEALNKQDRYDSLFAYYGEVYNISPYLLKAQAIVESRLNPDAEGKHGEHGLAQFMPETWNEWKDGHPGIYQVPGLEVTSNLTPFNPEHAIRAQAAYLRYLLDYFKSEQKALAAYNWGMGNIKKAIEKYGDRWERGLPLWTRQYMVKIAHYYVKFRSMKKKAKTK